MLLKDVLLVMLGSLIFALSRSGADEISLNEHSAFSFYKSFRLVTPTPAWVSADVAIACTAPGSIDKSDQSARINIFLNPTAEQHTPNLAGSFAKGSIIVKEKLDTNGVVTAVGGMIKRGSDFDPANNNWEYFYAEKTGGITTGRLASCIACHSNAKASDYVFSVTSASRPGL